MRQSIGAGPLSRRRTRSLALVLLTGGLVLTGCDGDDAGTDEQPTQAEAGVADGDGGGGGAGEDSAEQSAEPVALPTEPADIELVPVERSATQDGDTITVEGDRAAFSSPSGNIVCVLTEETATCQISDKDFTPNAEYLISDAVGACDVESANAMRMVDEGASWTCVEDSLLPYAGSAQGGWWAVEVDGETTEIDDLEVSVLPYGETLRVGPVSCTADQEGVTCRNPDMGGRRIVLSRNNYLFDRNA